MNRPGTPPQDAHAIVIHGLQHALAALRPGLPVILLSAPDAGAFAGSGWWRALIDAAIAAHPDTPCSDILDCGAAPGAAMAALRQGQRRLILSADCPAYPAVSAAAAVCGAQVLAVRPTALDLAQPGAEGLLKAYLEH
jgi:hypothetical protein